ncbi:MAG TPA: altronate dehydratase family protein [Flavisolibacter sp.]|jgi:altronate hydrolase|nr:altronate dehydratase family protein [Flavisolibacter sp.]
MPEKILKVHPADNVLVALQDLPQGETVSFHGDSITLKEPIPGKHKFFTHDMSKDEKVIMYGVTVGTIQQPVQKGSRMTIDNTVHAADAFAYRDHQYRWVAPDVSKFAGRTFKGYVRDDGRVGTANYWLFVPLVFCENRNLDVIKDALQSELGYSTPNVYRTFTRQLIHSFKNGEDIRNATPESLTPQPAAERLFKNIDGIKFLNHTMGCGGTRQDSAMLGKLLAAYADHPNVAGVTVLSLGCQHLQADDFETYVRERNPSFSKPVLLFEQQKTGSENVLVMEAIRQTFEKLVEANRVERTDVPLSALNVGVKCGGSDGFSGISANPAVGHCADLLVALGGKVLLAEFPELCGAEQDLIDRSVNRETAEKFIHLMTTYNQWAHSVGSGFHMNPSPGNIRDGLITDAIKSTGPARKGGTSPVVDVLDYTEPATKPGLSLVCTPGNDVEATTGKAASGATIILFTTGLGTPTGNPICPTIKVSTNTSLAKRMSDIIDFDTGEIIEGKKSIEQVGEEILEYVIKVASGEVIPKAVLLGQDDFIPWKRGVSL